MDKNWIGKFFLEKHLEGSPNFEDVDRDKRGHVFHSIVDFYEFLSSRNFKDKNYYSFLPENGFNGLDLTFFKDIVLKFLRFEEPADESLIENVEKIFTEYNEIFPESLLKFRKDLLELYCLNNLEQDASKNEMLEILQEIPKARLDW